MGIVFTGFSARLIDLQVAKHDEYTRLQRLKNIRFALRSRRIAE